MDPAKLVTMSKWPITIKNKEVEVFLRFANYDCQYIVNYIVNVRRLINLTKYVSFVQCHIQSYDRHVLRAGFLSPPILIQLDVILKATMECDATKQVIAGILSAYHVVDGCKPFYPVDNNTITISATHHN